MNVPFVLEISWKVAALPVKFHFLHVTGVSGQHIVGQWWDPSPCFLCSIPPQLSLAIEDEADPAPVPTLVALIKGQRQAKLELDSEKRN